MISYFYGDYLVIPFKHIYRVKDYSCQTEQLCVSLTESPNDDKYIKISRPSEQIENYKTWLIAQDKPTMLL